MERYWRRIVQANLNKKRGEINCLVSGGKSFSVSCAVPENILTKPEKILERAEEEMKNIRRMRELYFCIDDKTILSEEYTVMLLAAQYGFPVFATVGSEIELAFGVDSL